MGLRASLVVAVLALASGCDRRVTLEMTFAPFPDDLGALPVGVVLDLSGPGAEGSRARLSRLRQAIDRTNRAGGVHGRRIDLHVLDDRGRPGESGLAAQRFREDSATILLVSDADGERRSAIAGAGLPLLDLAEGERLYDLLSRVADYRPATIEAALTAAREGAGSGP